MTDHDQENRGGAVAPLDGPVHDLTPSVTPKAPVLPRLANHWLSTTLASKNLMALTGLFLCLFLVIHLFGNLQLLLPARVAQWQFNFYSELLSGNIFIQFISYALFGMILIHAIYALVISVRNRRSNDRRYQYDRRGQSSKWYARKMGMLGTIILFFLVIHLRDFWYQLQFGHVPLDKDGQRDLYSLVLTMCQNGAYVLIYVLCMVALGYHLLHGFYSAARTLGIYHPRYAGWVKMLGWVYSIGVSAGFAFIPVYVHFAR